MNNIKQANLFIHLYGFMVYKKKTFICVDSSTYTMRYFKKGFMGGHSIEIAFETNAYLSICNAFIQKYSTHYTSKEIDTEILPLIRDLRHGTPYTRSVYYFRDIQSKYLTWFSKEEFNTLFEQSNFNYTGNVRKLKPTKEFKRRYLELCKPTTSNSNMFDEHLTESTSFINKIKSQLG